MTQRAHPTIGQSVIYVDGYGNPHAALVTMTWNNSYGLDPKEGTEEWDPMSKKTESYTPTPDVVEALRVQNRKQPLTNVVFVSSDTKRSDSCGRQTEHETSVNHVSNNQGVHGRYWKFVDEE